MSKRPKDRPPNPSAAKAKGVGRRAAAPRSRANAGQGGPVAAAATKLTYWQRLQAIAARFGAGILMVALLALGADRLYPPVRAPLQATSTLVVDREGRLLRAFTNKAGAWRLPARVGDVDPLYLKMLIAYEDRRFRAHPGVDSVAIARALVDAVAAGKVVSGASTLTMQAARLLEPRRRTIGAKLAEMLRALQLEAHAGKDDILSIYLTLAPFGGNLEGVRAASLAYFGKEPRRLTPGEAALLVVLPQAPTSTRPDRHPERARAARDKVLRAMVRMGVLTKTAAREAMETPVPTRRRAMPFHAPHLARALHSGRRTSRERVLRTALDGELQRALERMVRHAAGALGARATIAILVVENRTRKVRAYVGSSDFFDAARSGQIDMVRALRSPGSTLKPFVYGLALDDRIIHPETIIADVPTRFGDYQPENFRRVYHGEVTVREALRQSLNVPAVVVMEKVGTVRLAARLRNVGAGLSFDPRRPVPGLPLALGGVGITLWDLTTLYGGLANGGRVVPLSVRPGGSGVAPPGRALMSAAAAWQLARILEGAPPPAEFVAASSTRARRRIAYKTGTSYGFRDAWAVGYDAAHTIGVWVGRPDGTPSPDRYGRNTAAPILYRAFGLMPAGDRPMPGPAPDGVVIATNAELPPHLRRFGTAARTAGGLLTAIRPLTIAFPPAGAVVELERRPGGGFKSLPLAAEGGTKPLKWLVNGRPIASHLHRRQARWAPDGEGFVRVMVIDAEGRIASAISRLK